MKLSAQNIADLTGGSVEGNPEAEISTVSKLEEADGQSLCFFSNPKYEQAFYSSKAGIVIVPQDFTTSQNVAFTMVRHANPYYAFCVVLDKYFNPNKHKTGIEAGSFISASANVGEEVYVGATAYIDDDAVVGKGCKVYPQVFIGKGSKVGANTILFPGVKIYDGCTVGANCIIHAGTVIGSDGFGFAPIGDVYAKIPQVGNVIIEDYVEIGSNCSIDRATMGSTYIRQGVKLDNLIQVAHNAEIGANTVIAAQAGISGSTKIGKNCQIGGQTGFVGHITIADKTGIGAQAGVSKAIEESGTNWIGTPALPLKEFFKSQAVFKNLPELQSRVNALEKKLNS
ncbi:MAG: UDP-3-O-(3-hydroxymyristoyl)glucosamine N-acyltransferase [Bacteroidetes bacterium]|nr:UDP-3-O-(3-hydroxymyristoyl)glucosamine N-acyltransferase [Bacteroidota bacterium]